MEGMSRDGVETQKAASSEEKLEGGLRRQSSRLGLCIFKGISAIMGVFTRAGCGLTEVKRAAGRV
jgi:hypothetical protein